MGDKRNPAQALAENYRRGKKNISESYSVGAAGDERAPHEERLDRFGKDVGRLLGWLDSSSKLYALLFDGLMAYSRTVSERTFNTVCTLLRRGLFSYSALLGLSSIESYDRFFWMGFKRWLDGLEKIGNPEGRLSTGSKKSLYHSAICPFRSLLKHNLHGDAVRKVMDVFPDNQWSRGHLASEPRKRLDIQALTNVWKAAEEEINLLIRTWALKDEVIGLERGMDRYSGEHDLRDLGIALVYFNDNYPGEVPTNKILRERSPQAYRYVYSSNDSDNVGLRNIVEYLYPRSRRLAPFIVQLAIESALNPESLLRLSFSDIQVKSVFGVDQLYLESSNLESGMADEEEILDITPPKARSTFPPRASLSISIWRQRFEFLEKYTLSARNSLPDQHKDRVFSFFSQSGEPTIFISSMGVGSFKYSLDSFISDHGLEKFTLMNIRKTVLDEELRQSGDLLAVSQKAGHRSPDTLLNHYTSDGTKKWYREKLGEAMSLRDRWIQTNGVIDPRSSQRASKLDMSSATPGFLCLDPLNSPRPGQHLNKLCQAYGECPSCPLAVANVNDPVSVAYYMALVKSIVNSRESVNFKAWQASWDDVLGDLVALLDLVTDSVKEKAVDINISLPKVG